MIGAFHISQVHVVVIGETVIYPHPLLLSGNHVGTDPSMSVNGMESLRQPTPKVSMDESAAKRPHQLGVIEQRLLQIRWIKATLSN
jgi:hypothetical protein